ncbi:MAG: hypothetical protein JW896_00095 [Deltaproteobacteria bacterium]|nr:hypothetical protein [Deltaproteobacteria bacterium]
MENKEDIIEALNAWFDGQNRWKTKKELAAELGLSHSTVRKYFSEGRIPRKPENRDKLYQLTDLSCLEPAGVTPQDPESRSAGAAKPEQRFESNRPTSQMIISLLNDILDSITKDVSERVKIRSYIQSLSRSWERGDLDTVSWMIHGDIRDVLRRHYPEAGGIFEEIEPLLRQRGGQKIDEFELLLEHYCDEKGIKLTGSSPRFVVDHLIDVDFDRKRNAVMVGMSLLQNPDWAEIQRSIEGEHKRIWGRVFNFFEFYEELLMSYNDIIKNQRAYTNWAFLKDIYGEIKKRRMKGNLIGTSIIYPRDEFSADLSKLWWAQNSGYNDNFQMEFSSNRDPRFCFEVILPDESIALYGFMRPKKT